mmetsp:Transcript_9916/g.16053  ORF Transcript_9916/g.16053 Transcript_9916/m.16053 type:complete len:85 (-) Transcript_9916:113-367(-)
MLMYASAHPVPVAKLVGILGYVFFLGDSYVTLYSRVDFSTCDAGCFCTCRQGMVIRFSQHPWALIYVSRIHRSFSDVSLAAEVS